MQGVRLAHCLLLKEILSKRPVEKAQKPKDHYWGKMKERRTSAKDMTKLLLATCPYRHHVLLRFSQWGRAESP
jgi:hypothetical protein